MEFKEWMKKQLTERWNSFGDDHIFSDPADQPSNYPGITKADRAKVIAARRAEELKKRNKKYAPNADTVIFGKNQDTQ